MTSPMTDKETREYFEEKNYFGVDKKNVKFFTQGTLPCLTPEGKIIMQDKCHVSCGPDGNGGIYMAMHKEGVIDDMIKRNIKYVHTFGVDNAVVKVADPIFVGYMIEQKAEVGCKSCPKACPEEAVGVLCKKDGCYTIVEYSELDSEIAKRTNPDGSLYLNNGFICNLGYSINFLNTVCHPDNLPRVYHLANKKIPCADPKTGETIKPEKPNGIKLESFIFDVFPAIKNLAVYQVNRAEEFSPVKNAPGNPIDSPDSARLIFSNNHKKWLINHGAKVEGDNLCEVSPLLSYCGEGLEKLKDTELKTPCLVEVEKETLKKVDKLGEKLNDHVNHTVIDGVNIYSVV